VEEAASKYCSNIPEHFVDANDGFMAGANWQKAQGNKEVIATIEEMIFELDKEDKVTINAYDKAFIYARKDELTTLLATLNKNYKYKKNEMDTNY